MMAHDLDADHDVGTLQGIVRQRDTQIEHAKLLLHQALREWHVPTAALIWVRFALDELDRASNSDGQRE